MKHLLFLLVAVLPVFNLSAQPQSHTRTVPPAEYTGPQGHHPSPQPVVFRFIEKMPVFIGDLNKYLAENIRYPDSSRDRNEEGRTVLRFIVGKSGLIRDLQVIRSAGFPLLDSEAVRVFRPMMQTAHWKPGKQDGKLADVEYALPVTFRLD